MEVGVGVEGGWGDGSAVVVKGVEYAVVMVGAGVGVAVGVVVEVDDVEGAASVVSTGGWTPFFMFCQAASQRQGRATRW